MGFGCCGFEKKHTSTGIEKDRSCTDLIFLLLFVLGWIASFYTLGYAVDAGGDPDKLIRGVNNLGQICGKTSAVADLPYAMWPSPTVFGYKVCAASCDETKTDERFIKKYSSKRFVHYCLPWFDGSAENLLDAFEVFGNNTVAADQNGDSETVTRAIGDVYTAWPLFVIAAFVAMIMSFVYMWGTKYFATLMVWLCILFIIVGGFFLGYLCLKKADEYKGQITVTLTDEQLNASVNSSPNTTVTVAQVQQLAEANGSQQANPNREKAVRILGWMFIVATVIFMLIIFFLRSRIKIAIEIVKEAGRAVMDIKSLAFFPLIPIIFALLYFIYWIITALYIFSVSDAKTVGNYSWPPPGDINDLLDDTYIDYYFRQSFRGYAAYHIFHLLWVVQFLFYFGYLVIAGTVADWYFTKRGPNGGKLIGDGPHELSKTPVCHSIIRTLRYHLGTVALCALIIAIIQFIRMCVKYIEEKCSGPEPNYIQKAVFCCIQCCLKCIECCMDKINKNALIWTAIWGDGFCTAACSSFKLLWANLARVAMFNVVSTFIFFMGKVTVATFTSGCFLWLLTDYPKYKDEISSPLLPVLIIFIISYVIALLFMTIFESTADTIFLCFLVDEDCNKGGEMFASDSLKALVDKHSVANTAQANKMQQNTAQVAPSPDTKPLISPQPVQLA